MLQLRPTCEHCNKKLAPDSTEAMICSYECTFCIDCVELLNNVCPNCGGGFYSRPIRPTRNLKNSNYLSNNPASLKVVHKPVNLAEHALFSSPIKLIPPKNR